jgi:hypothetical protein
MRFLLFCSAALLAVVMLAVACDTVDPGDCWPNTSGGLGGSGTIPIGAGVGVGSGDFASPRFGPLGYGAPANPCVTGGDKAQPGGPPGPPATSTGTGGGAPFAGIDPKTLSTEALGASGLAWYLDSAATYDGVDPSDLATMAEFMGLTAPEAETAVDDWLMTIDSSMIPTAGVAPKDECYFDLGCPRRTTCVNPGTWSTDVPHICYVVNCGVPKCSLCPDWFPPEYKTGIVKAWCSYLCISQGVSPPPIVAQGAVVITKSGKAWPSNNLAWCFNP